MKKKHRIFYAKKKWVPEYFTVGFLYNGCLLGLTTFFFPAFHPVRVAMPFLQLIHVHPSNLKAF